MASGSPQVVVVGAGPGGYAAAFRAADLGLRTVLVAEEHAPGGVCLHRGCIPSKALLHAAQVLGDAREAAEFGITFGQPTIDLDRLREWKNAVVEKLTGGVASLCKMREVTYVQGRAEFQDAHTLTITRPDGTEETITFEHAIVATGSRPAIPDALRLDSPRVLDSTGALALESLPPRLLVIGGGYIGLEMATVYAALGS